MSQSVLLQNSDEDEEQKPKLVLDSDFACLVEEMVTAGKVVDPVASNQDMTLQVRSYQYIGIHDGVRIFLRNIKQWVSIHHPIHDEGDSTSAFNKERQPLSSQKLHPQKLHKSRRRRHPSSTLGSTINQIRSFASLTFQLFINCILTMVRRMRDSQTGTLLCIPLANEIIHCLFSRPGSGCEFFIVPFIIATISILLVKNCCRLSPPLSFFVYVIMGNLIYALIHFVIFALFSFLVVCGLAIWVIDGGKFVSLPTPADFENVESQTLKKIPHVGVGSLTMPDVSPVDVFQTVMNCQSMIQWLPDVMEVRQQSFREARHSDCFSEIFQLPSPTDMNLSSLLSTVPYPDPSTPVLASSILSSFIQCMLCSNSHQRTLRRCSYVRYWGVFSDGSIFIISYKSKDASALVAEAQRVQAFSPPTEMYSGNVDSSSTLFEINRTPSHGNSIIDQTTSSLRTSFDKMRQLPKESKCMERLADRILSFCENLTSRRDVNIVRCSNVWNSDNNVQTNDIPNCNSIVGWLITPLGHAAQSSRVTQLIGLGDIDSATDHSLPSILNEMFILRRLQSMVGLYHLIIANSKRLTAPVLPTCLQCFEREANNVSSRSRRGRSRTLGNRTPLNHSNSSGGCDDPWMDDTQSLRLAQNRSQYDDDGESISDFF